MQLNKKQLEEYLKYGLVDESEIEIILKRADSEGIHDNLRLEIIGLLEKNIKRNEAEIEQIDADLVLDTKREQEFFDKTRTEVKKQAKDIAKERYDSYKRVKAQQARTMQNVEIEMERVDRKLGELVSEKKADFESSILEKVRQKISKN